MSLKTYPHIDFVMSYLLRDSESAPQSWLRTAVGRRKLFPRKFCWGLIFSWRMKVTHWFMTLWLTTNIEKSVDIYRSMIKAFARFSAMKKSSHVQYRAVRLNVKLYCTLQSWTLQSFRHIKTQWESFILHVE